MWPLKKPSLISGRKRVKVNSLAFFCLGRRSAYTDTQKQWRDTSSSSSSSSRCCGRRRTSRRTTAAAAAGAALSCRTRVCRSCFNSRRSWRRWPIASTWSAGSSSSSSSSRSRPRTATSRCCWQSRRRRRRRRPTGWQRVSQI